jgi:hypothetical protein
MTRERTPTPWGIERTRHGLWIGPMRADGMKVDVIVLHLNYGVDYTDEHNTRQDANAEFIVRAVNSYDDMLAALVSLTNSADGLSFREEAIRAVVGNTNWRVLREHIEQARAAISRAESTALSGQPE